MDELEAFAFVPPAAVLSQYFTSLVTNCLAACAARTIYFRSREATTMVLPAGSTLTVITGFRGLAWANSFSSVEVLKS
jgi:hypothetical protein